MTRYWPAVVAWIGLNAASRADVPCGLYEQRVLAGEQCQYGRRVGRRLERAGRRVGDDCAELHGAVLDQQFGAVPLGQQPQQLEGVRPVQVDVLPGRVGGRALDEGGTGFLNDRLDRLRRADTLPGEVGEPGRAAAATDVFSAQQLERGLLVAGEPHAGRRKVAGDRQPVHPAPQDRLARTRRLQVPERDHDR